MCVLSFKKDTIPDKATSSYAETKILEISNSQCVCFWSGFVAIISLHLHNMY